MGDEVNQAVKIVFNGEIKPPPSIDPGLPDTAGLIVFLGPKGRMAQVAEEMAKLFPELTLNSFRRLAKGTGEAR